jgi:predicted Zn-dependent peptidase
MKVVTRSAPGSGAVAITLGYRKGSDDDPAGRSGLAQLLGELSFTAAAGKQPERAPEELDSQRPLGWSYPVLRHMTLLTEVASADRFPQVLAQVAERARGVTFDAAQLGAARARVKKELAQQLFGDPTVVLNHQLAEIARGRSDGEIVRHASGSEIERATVAELQQELQRWHCPANAVLSLVGDFGPVDLHALVEKQFGRDPGRCSRVPSPRPPRCVLRPGRCGATAHRSAASACWRRR